LFLFPTQNLIFIYKNEVCRGWLSNTLNPLPLPLLQQGQRTEENIIFGTKNDVRRGVSGDAGFSAGKGRNNKNVPILLRHHFSTKSDVP